MKTYTLTLLMALTAVPVMADHHPGGDHTGMHQMPDGTWMGNHEMEVSTKSEPAKAIQTTGKTIVASVNGLVCDFCAQSIKKTLMKKPGVADVHVDLTAKTVTVGFKDDKVLDEATLKAMLKEAGYDMTAYKVQ